MILWVVEMKENTEIEEGEACYYTGDDEANIDPDSFSYIDEKVQHFLGHFRKDFEGVVSAENLGAKFGGHGSFLPTQERSTCLCSHSRTPQRNHSSPKLNINLYMEAVSHNTKASSNVLPARPENSSHSSHSFRDLEEASVNDSVKKEHGISSSDIAERCTLKDDSTKKTGNSTDERPLKFRIKMKSNILAQKNAEIYSGLGLDNAPSSSMGNSPVESEGMPPVSQENAEDSPNGIIQVMTSFPIFGGVLISPLHESLLYMIKNEKVIRDSKYLSSLKGHQDTCSMSTDESDSFVGDEHLKERTVRSNGDSLKEKKSERKVDSVAGIGAIKNGNISNGKNSAFGTKVKERLSGHKVAKQLLAGPCMKDTSAALPIAENNLAPEMISSAVGVPQVIAEDWVCCDSCQKWRLLPNGLE